MADISAPALLLKCCEKYFLNVFLKSTVILYLLLKMQKGVLGHERKYSETETWFLEINSHAGFMSLA